MSILNKNEIKNLIDALSTPEEVVSNKYKKPVLKELTKEEIDAIHNAGRITPSEWLTEMEEKYVEICPLSNESSRCKIFADCHDCLVDYANSEGSFPNFSTYKGNFISKQEINNLIEALSTPEEESQKPVVKSLIK